MRLHNFLKNKYNLTKSELKPFMENNNVLVDSKKASLTTVVNYDSKIEINGELVDFHIDYKYYAFYKPRGIVCTNNRNVDYNLSEYINFEYRLFPIGRLDKDSEGLLVLTNDQAICNKFLSKDNHIEKEYLVEVDKPIDEKFIFNMSNGVNILNTITKKCICKKIDDYTFDIILKEGLNRQIRRMTKVFNRNVVRLKRIRFGKLKLELYPSEIKEINLNDIE